MIVAISMSTIISTQKSAVIVIKIPVTVPSTLMEIASIDRTTPGISITKPGTLMPNLMRTTNLIWNRS